MDPLPQEIELKLTLDAQDTRALTRHPVLQAASSAPVTRTLHSIYFDTPEAELRERGAALRLRRVGRRWWQTLKHGGSATAGLHARAEEECAVARNALALDRIQEHSMRRRLARWQAEGVLQPCFETVFKRTLWIVETAAGDTIECALDRGEIRALGRPGSEPICELELELKAGNAAALFALARALGESIAFELEDRSKAERGYALALGETAPAPVRAEPVQLDDDATAGSALAQIVSNGLTQVHRNRRAVLQARRYNPECVHQLRVGLRRLRTALGVFAGLDPSLRTLSLREALRSLAQLAGVARNWDVFLSETLSAAQRSFADEPGWDRLRRRARREQRKARQALRAALAARRYFFLALDLGELVWNAGNRPELSTPVPPFAARFLARRRKQLHARVDDGLEAKTRHELRIAAKKLRYSAEFFGSLFARGKCDRFVDRLSALQDTLGLLNDLAVARALCVPLQVPEEPDSLHLHGVLTGWWAAQEQTGLVELAQRLDDARRAAPFWPNPP